MMTDITVSQLLLWVVGQIVVGATIWGGIRVDIKSIHERVKMAQDTANGAHHRIDVHLEKQSGLGRG